MPKGKGGRFGGGRRALTLGRSPAPDAAPLEEPESEEDLAVEEASLAALAELGLDDDSSDDGEPEDLMGDQSWAKTDDFSGGMDSLFADMMGGQSVDEMRAELAAHGVDVDAEVRGIGEDAAAAETAEAERKAEEEAKAAAEDEKRKAAAARAEQRRNMTKEEKAAKIKANQYRKKAAAMQEEGTLVDTAQYEEGLRLVEEEDWLAAEAALKAAASSSEVPVPPLSQPEPEPEPEPKAGGVPPEPGSGQVASHDAGALEHEVAELRAKLDGLVAKKVALAGARRFREAGAAKKEVEAATLLLRQKEAALSQLHRASQEKAAAETVAGHPAPEAEQTEADHGAEGTVAGASSADDEQDERM